jgi:hypothetical protein
MKENICSLETAEGTVPRVDVRNVKHSHYNVNPRYTAGSPAAVDRATADKVAAEEIDSCAMAMSGVMGQWNADFAKMVGVGPHREDKGQELQSPAEYVEEHSNHWLVQCLCTGKLFIRPFAWQEEKQKPCKRCAAAKEMIYVER